MANGFAAPDVFGGGFAEGSPPIGGDIQSRLAMALQDPRMRERLIAALPQILQNIQAVGGPLAQSLAQRGTDRMPMAMQAELLRGGVAGLPQPAPGAPGDVSAQPMPVEVGPGLFADPGTVGGGGTAEGWQPPGFDDNGLPVGGGPILASPQPAPVGGNIGAAPMLGGGGAFADLRNQYGDPQAMADRRRTLSQAMAGGGEFAAPQPAPGKPPAATKLSGGAASFTSGKGQSPEEVAAYWTPERMAKAGVGGMGAGGDARAAMSSGGTVAGIPGQSGRYGGINPGGGKVKAQPRQTVPNKPSGGGVSVKPMPIRRGPGTIMKPQPAPVPAKKKKRPQPGTGGGNSPRGGAYRPFQRM